MEDIGKKILLSIDQVSKLTGVKKPTLRYWERSFNDYLKPSRTETRRREYSLKDLDRISTIKKLIEEEHLTKIGVKLRLGQLNDESKNS